MWLGRGYLRSKRGRMSVLIAGIAAAAAFALLSTSLARTSLAAPSVAIHGLASAATIHVVNQPAGPHGRPAPRDSEARHRRDTATMVATGPDRRSIALVVLVQTAGAAFFTNGVGAVLHGRRRELATLRALGWRRKQVRRHLMREFAPIAITAGLLAVPTAYAAEALLSRQPTSAWSLLSMPVAVAMTLAAAWWPVQRVTAESEPTAVAAARRPAVGRQPRVAGQAVRNLLRTPSRTALGTLVIAAACAALGLELAARWALNGGVVGSWLGRPASWQANAIDVGAVLVILAIATVTVADIDWLTAGERAAELRTLRAIGWPARGVVRLVVWEAVLLGLAGGLIASVLDVAGSLAVVHHAPVRLLLAAAAVTGAGAVVSLAAAGLAAAAGFARGNGVSR